MVKLNNIKMKPKLIALFLIAGLFPILVVGLWSSKQATQSLMEQSFNQLTSVRGIKKAQIEKYFEERRGDMGVLDDTVQTLRNNAFQNLDAVHDGRTTQLQRCIELALNSIDVQASSANVEELWHQLVAYHNRTKVQPDGPYDVTTAEYQQIWSEYGAQIKLFQETFGFYDVFMICAAHGHVMYSTAKKADLGTNVHTGPYRDSGLNAIWAKTINNRERSIVDFSPYAPSNGDPAAFVGVPLFVDNKLRGVMAVQLSPDQINNIMSNRSGLGKTGEAYLVGPDHLMRSDSYLNQEHYSLKASFANPDKGRVATEAVEHALAGQDGQDVITNYNGNQVLSVFAPFKVMDLTWAIIAEMDVAEAFSPVDDQGQEYYAKYIEKYGYYDLFLINPDGFVFYTVTKEADYQTNMVDGKYSRSNLGELVRRVLKSKQYGMADFRPYEPSNGAPAAFIAEPIIHDGKVVMVIALQLPLEGINSIMQLREGMGESGESYLVGPDKLMRSDSFLDKTGHSVAASFAGTVEDNGVDTEAARQALAGESDAKVIIDYNGNPVLSSYTPVKVGDITWALLAEIDEAEVKAPIKAIIMSITLVACVIAVLVAALALFVARQIAQPLEKGLAFAKNLSDKDLTQKLAIDQQDEIGDLAQALNQMAGNLSSMIKDIDGGVATLSSSSTEMAAIADQMAAGSETTVEKSNTVASAAEEMNSNMTSVAAAMEQAATNVGTVASGAEQMSSSIAEIAENAARAKESAGNAVQRTDQASAQINELGQAAEEIGVVSETIKSISDKTNLLALNATIEAARAGEAGKGFAVVANEIKELAQQTADATGDIAQKLQGIQKSTGSTVNEIDEVGKAIKLVDEVVSAIAAAVEEQNTATKDISDNVGQASLGLQEINENVNQTSEAAGQVAQEITEVNEAAGEMSNSSAQVQQSAGELSKLSEQLKELVGQFKL